MMTFFVDPHIHMSSRTTDDYVAMAQAGIAVIIEPAFWLGQPRTSAGTFIDYYSSLLGWERFRASQYGIRHFCAIGLNSKESNNQRLAEEVIEILPKFLIKEGVVAVGEIGFDEQTQLEERFLQEQLALAKEFDLPVMIHTPHRNKLKGTLRTMDIIQELGINVDKVVIDHNTEQTVKAVLERGYWAAFTIYPETKMDSERMARVVAEYGADRVIVDSSADWGYSDPLAVPKTAAQMQKIGISQEQIYLSCCKNALTAYGLSNLLGEMETSGTLAVDQRNMYENNSVLRGQQPRIEEGR
ncbi:TatD family hydrolase [Nitrosomonas sp.]|uniref:TatD family hydrolase n=1 Tax=Nitrosomonas sp. TaxID=42353 RepID=UPI00330642C7